MPQGIEPNVASTGDEIPDEWEGSAHTQGRSILLLLFFILGGVALGSILGSIFKN